MRPLSDGAITGVLKRLGDCGRQSKEGVCHLISTAFIEQGYASDWLERQLADGDPDKIRGTYNKAAIDFAMQFKHKQDHHRPAQSLVV